MPGRTRTATTCLVALVLSAAVTALPVTPAQAQATALPGVYPVPQSLRPRGESITLGPAVSMVAGPSSDSAATRVVRQVLTDAGVGRIDVVANLADATDGEPAVIIDGPAAVSALKALTVTGAEAIAAEGYVLATGKVSTHDVVVLDGHDRAGTFYAAQTLRQLVVRSGGKATLAGVEVRDWPTYPIRGVIEGFYGTPWSHQARLDQLNFYGAHKMNAYVYSPKDDPYLRERWRDAYPANQLAQLKELTERAIANHVELTYAISPGLSVCYSSATDEQALATKFQTLWDIGVRAFAVPLDDISYTDWNCEADRAKFGTGGAAAGAAQSFLLNAIQRDFIATHPGASRLEMVPTEYADVSISPYKTAIKEGLDPAVIVEWTGVGVVAPVLTAAQSAAAKSVFGHDILVWDNYPVNDYATDRLLLGPYVGRDAGLRSSLHGITANPMIQPEASKIALFNVADYTWNDAAYNSQNSWQASLTELAGGDPEARAALAAFADLEHYSSMDRAQAPVLAARIAAFWPAWERGNASTKTALDDYLKIIGGIPSTLELQMSNPAFIADAKPWIDSASAWGRAGSAALQMLTQQRDDDGAGALTSRAKVNALVVKAKSFTYAGLRGTERVTVGDGVIDQFVTDALAESNRWFGLAGRPLKATTSLATYQANAPAMMVDGDDGTFFWSQGSPSAGDYVGVDLGAVEPITSAAVHMAKPSSPDDYIHAGVLEYSADGSRWTSAGAFAQTPDVTATLPPGTSARYVRLRATDGQGNWVVVREFTVVGPQLGGTMVSGTPAAATGSKLAAASDANLESAYVAASVPKDGDALTVMLPRARPLERVLVAGTGSASVEIQSKGTWRTIGALDETGYTELSGDGVTTGAIRLVWSPGSPAPRIAEIVPWYADLPAAGLTVTPPTADTSAGIAVQMTAVLAATRASTVTGTLAAAVPPGVTAAPGSTSVTLTRGARIMVSIALTATVAGSYQVPVSFTPSVGAAVMQPTTLVVHPRVSTTNVALASGGAVATASSVEQDLPQFSAPHANDGDTSTRWSSTYADGEWLQIDLARPQHLGKVVLRWEAAHATAYKIQTSTDGLTWTTAADVTSSQGGTETIWIDQIGVTSIRMQGVTRSSGYGYSLYEFEAYPVA